MADGSFSPLDPQELLDRTFTSVRRGFDQTEVRQLLARVADQLQVARDREAALELLLAEAEIRVEASDPLDPDHLTKLLGDETARILDAARAAATEIRLRADESARRLLDEAKAEGEELAAGIIDAARLEAREIVRLAEQFRDELGASPAPSADPEAGRGETEGSAVVQSTPVEPVAPSPARRRRTEESRTTDLFARLREAQAEAAPVDPPKPKPARRRRTTPTPAPEIAPAPAPAPVTANAPTAEVVTEHAPAPAAPPVPVAAAIDLAPTARRLKRELSDDQNLMLSALGGPGSRRPRPEGEPGPDLRPSIERYVAIIEASLLESTAVRGPAVEESALQAAHALLTPLRDRVDAVLGGGAGDGSGEISDDAAEHLRACFREVRSHGVDAALASVLPLLESAVHTPEG